MINVWVKSTIIVSVFALKKLLTVQCTKMKLFLQFYDICGYKKIVGQQKMSPYFGAVVGSGIGIRRDPVSWMDKIRILDPG
jgi:hypothetical protein